LKKKTIAYKPHVRHLATLNKYTWVH